MQASSAISFRLPPASFSAAAWPGSPLLSSFRFLASLGFHFHGRLPFPLLFLTPAVFAPFRSLQFWVLTTQPLFSLSALFTLLPHSCFCAAPSVLSSLRFSPSFPAGFPSVLSGSAYLALLFVSFRPSLLRSHSCSASACLVPVHFRSRSPGIFPFRPASFRPLPASRLSYSAFSLFLSASSLTCLAPARSVLRRFFRPDDLLFLPPWFPVASVRFRLLGSLPRSLSSFPVHLPQLTSRCWPYFLLPLVRFFLRPLSSLASVLFRSLPLQALTTQVSVSSFLFSRSSSLTVTYLLAASALTSTVSPFFPA